MAETSLVWQRGLLNSGGPHRVLKGTLFPISIGEDECAVFGKLIERFCPENTFIIGNAFGFSSCYIADVMRQCGGTSVITLDSEVEGRGQDCASVARRLADTMELSLLKNKKGWSPQDTAWAAEDKRYDLVFIDGDHSHPQVTRDFEGILPFTDSHTIFVWHDFWLSGINPCLDLARSKGFKWLWLPTSCEMVLGVRDARVFAELQTMFPNSVENQHPHSPLLAPTLIAKEFVRQAWDTAITRYLPAFQPIRRSRSDR
ncbi:MAG: class I SAM-dependent methyltransferase [Anaerolineales bacterium]|nr:class I SAM-dependent methyltransferase [Anaerolineales bacterium]